MTLSIASPHRLFLALLLCLPLAGGAVSAPRVAEAAPWVVRPEWVKADLAFLAGDALAGRGSATRDEAIAASYVASQFQSFGLIPAPGMQDYLQQGQVIQPRLGKAPVLSIGSKSIADVTLLIAPSAELRGDFVLLDSGDAEAMPEGGVIAIASLGQGALLPAMRAARSRHTKLLIVRQSEDTDRLRERLGGEARVSAYLEGAEPDTMAVAVLAPGAFDRLSGKAGQQASLTLPGMTLERQATTNAIGFLPGTDPEAGVLLLSAHLDHLGQRADGVIMHGADDDASGVAAVLELARALAASPRSRRGILFVCYGSEEMGGFGSRYFAAHSPVPLARIAANIEFEMIGAQDPKLAGGSLMMTGSERSNLAEALKAHGALIAADPYPDQHFFERSDNYSLALEGVVAHTLSGWAVTPVYHQPTDTIANIDFPFMTRAIQSLVEPVRWLAASAFEPQWKTGGQPQR